TCEGLESFLVPAVEQALAFSTVLETLETTGHKQAFADTVIADLKELLDHWLAGRFSGEPYAVEANILSALMPKHAMKIKRLDSVEAAAMACRVLTHVVTLKLASGNDEAPFRQLIDADALLDDQRLFDALKNAIEFLIKAFRKGEGKTEEERICNAKTGEE